MAIPDWFSSVVGHWQGESTLHLSWLPEEERVRPSPSTLEIRVDPGQTFSEWHYTWVEDGNTERGVMLLAGSKDGGAFTIGWVDSWHQSGDVMKLVGTSGRVIDCRGTYQVKDHPDWGWRILLEAGEGSETVVLKMFNISPEGEEEWAVVAEYRRSAKENGTS